MILVRQSTNFLKRFLINLLRGGYWYAWEGKNEGVCLKTEWFPLYLQQCAILRRDRIWHLSQKGMSLLACQDLHRLERLNCVPLATLASPHRAWRHFIQLELCSNMCFKCVIDLWLILDNSWSTRWLLFASGIVFCFSVMLTFKFSLPKTPSWKMWGTLPKRKF